MSCWGLPRNERLRSSRTRLCRHWVCRRLLCATLPALKLSYRACLSLELLLDARQLVLAGDDMLRPPFGLKTKLHAGDGMIFSERRGLP